MPRIFTLILLLALSASLRAADAPLLDDVSRAQADFEKKLLVDDEKHTQTDGIAQFRKTAIRVEYTAGQYKLPGYLYKPKGDGPFPAILWNHGSEKSPTAQPELARFYTQHGYVFFVPIRHGHGKAPGDYIGDESKAAAATQSDRAETRKEIVALHELYNLDVVAAVTWLKQQPFVDPTRLVVSGCSYGGIQTLLTAEKGLGVRAFIAFAPGAMSFANTALQDRMAQAAANAKAPLFVLQAENDYSTGPTKLLAPILEKLGQPSYGKIYPAFGDTHALGHGGFACYSLGASIWGADVLQFIDAAMKIAPPATQPANP